MTGAGSATSTGMPSLSCGRTRSRKGGPHRPARTHVGLIDAVVATGEWPQPHFRPGPEQRRILELCHRPKPVVDLASETDLPVGVVRVLLGDLSTRDCCASSRPSENRILTSAY